MDYYDNFLKEIFIPYNNAIHSATRFTHFELFYGRTYKIGRQITFNNEHKHLFKINLFQTQLYESIRKKIGNRHRQTH